MTMAIKLLINVAITLKMIIPTPISPNPVAIKCTGENLS